LWLFLKGSDLISFKEERAVASGGADGGDGGELFVILMKGD